MGFDFSNASGESFGNIEDVFFKKDGKPLANDTPHGNSKVDLAELNKTLVEKSDDITKQASGTSSGTVINISKEVIDSNEDLHIELSEQEERRMNISSIRNKPYIDVDTGEEVVIVEKTEMYNGANLFTVKQESGKMITYPRSMFVGSKKKFVPKDFYIREAERALEDTIEQHSQEIYEYLKTNNTLNETSDAKYLEVMLDIPLNVVGGIPIPDKVQIPVKRLFDLEYKLLVLENVICLDNKVASLLFLDVWF